MDAPADTWPSLASSGATRTHIGPLGGVQPDRLGVVHVAGGDAGGKLLQPQGHRRRVSLPADAGGLSLCLNQSDIGQTHARRTLRAILHVRPSR